MLQHFQSPFPLDSDQTIDRIICIGFRVVDPPCLETQEGRNMEGSIFQNFLSLILVHLSPKPTLIFKTGHIMFLPPSIQTLNVSITYLKIPMIEFFFSNHYRRGSFCVLDVTRHILLYPRFS